MTEEMGKPIQQGIAEAEKCAVACGSASLSVLVGLIGRLADKRACERTWIGLPGRTCGFLGSGETAIVG
jgi:hypothetical protein